MEESLRPRIYDFVVIRLEPNSAILFNPYLNTEIALDDVERYLAALCTGEHPIAQIAALVSSRFRWPIDVSRAYVQQFVQHLVAGFNAELVRLPEQPFVPPPKFDPTPSSGTSPPAPRNVIWEVTQRCNLACRHCLNSSGRPARAELSTAEAKELIDSLVEWQVLRLSLSGGEPLRRPDIRELLSYLAETHLRIDIATNGVGIAEPVFAALAELPIFRIQVSIDGMAEQHDLIRGRPGAFDGACATLQRLGEMGIQTVLGMTAMAENIDAVDELCELALSLGCSEIKVIPFLPSGRGRDRAETLSLDRHALKRLSQRLRDKQQQFEGVLAVSTDTTHTFLLEEPQVGSGLDADVLGCAAGYDSITIGADGVAYPCPFLRDFALGSVRETSLPLIWQNSAILRKLRSFRRHHLRSPCSECEYVMHPCRGGCRAAAYFETGDLYAPDPTCFRTTINGESVYELACCG